MALPTKVKMMELRDAKIAKLVTDNATAPTYGTSVDLEGMTKITITPKTKSNPIPHYHFRNGNFLVFFSLFLYLW